ncbi:MAG: hypothetical protein D6675_02405 [Gemmatimonadetes bacterium]|nr:MAG: hypothetical protein D6675_02405 [Gemmatimonadota bacterium]
MPTLDFSQVNLIPIASRANKVSLENMAQPVPPDASFATFWDALPDILAVQRLKTVAQAIAHAHLHQKPVIAMVGAHTIKCGLSPIFVEMMKQRLITCFSANGAFAIHDFEFAFWGNTSEDVAQNLKDGSFGMAQETGEGINLAIRERAEEGIGFGQIVGDAIVRADAPNKALSILATGAQEHLPVTIHVAIGTDIIHQQPSADGAAIGRASYDDFKKLAGVVAELGNGGVVLNLGSAVIMPEVFLKALTVARNLGYPVTHFTTANFDMIQHYRPNVNVVSRPVMSGGQGYSITGHHEILLPLLYTGTLLELSRKRA